MLLFFFIVLSNDSNCTLRMPCPSSLDPWSRWHFSLVQCMLEFLLPDLIKNLNYVSQFNLEVLVFWNDDLVTLFKSLFCIQALYGSHCCGILIPFCGIILSIVQYLITHFNDFQLACLGSFFLHESVFFLSGLPFIYFERAGWLSKYKIQVSFFWIFSKYWIRI